MNSNRGQLGPYAAALLLVVAAFPASAQPQPQPQPQLQQQPQQQQQPQATRQPAAEPIASAARPAVLASEQQADAEARGGEPNVRRTVIEDNGSKIEELRVRGQTQRISVTPKIGLTKRYDIITGDASRDSTYGTGGARDAVGKRVWGILDF